MKTTLDLPDELVREIKLRAVHEGRKLKDVIADLLRAGLTPQRKSSGRNGPPVAKNLPLMKVRPAPPAEVGKLSTQQWCDWLKDMDLQLEVERYEKALDVNTWIALTLETHLHHQAARHWYDEAAFTRGDLVFCRQTELGFLRLITQDAVMRQCGAAPLSNAEAVEFLSNVYDDPAVSRADEPTATRSLWLELADRAQASPNVWMDAYLAAFAIALGAELVTFDRGFTTYQRRGLNCLVLDSP